MARPRTEPVEVRRRRILDAARGLLIRSAYQGLSLDDLARRAGMAKGTLYLYFKDKDALLLAVFEDMLERLDMRIKQVAPPDGTLASLRRLAAEGLDFVDETHYFLSTFSSGSRILHGPCVGKSEHDRYFQKHIAFLAEHVKAGMESGLLRRVDPETGALFFISLMRMFMTRKFLSGGRRPLRGQAPDFLELFLGGLGGKA